MYRIEKSDFRIQSDSAADVEESHLLRLSLQKISKK